MAVSYERSYDHGTPTVVVTITVLMRTGYADLGEGKFAPTNTLQWQLDAGTVQEASGIKDDDLLARVSAKEVELNAFIDGTPNTTVDTELQGAGYTKTIS